MFKNLKAFVTDPLYRHLSILFLKRDIRKAFLHVKLVFCYPIALVHAIISYVNFHKKHISNYDLDVQKKLTRDKIVYDEQAIRLFQLCGIISDLMLCIPIAKQSPEFDHEEAMSIFQQANDAIIDTLNKMKETGINEENIDRFLEFADNMKRVFGYNDDERTTFINDFRSHMSKINIQFE